MKATPFCLSVVTLALVLLPGCESSTPGQVAGGSLEVATTPRDAIRLFFRTQNKQVLTFIGYSGAGYEDEARMLQHARETLEGFDPAKTIVNIGATPDGIGAVYELAKSMGFETTGIVSVQAKKYEAAISPHVDHVFFVEDEIWGGFLEGTEQLSPTSQAMVESSDVFVSIGGGEVARDELVAARRLGKSVKFIPADMNHRKVIEKAEKKGLPAPTDFRGAAHAVFWEG